MPISLNGLISFNCYFYILITSIDLNFCIILKILTTFLFYFNFKKVQVLFLVILRGGVVVRGSMKNS